MHARPVPESFSHRVQLTIVLHLTCERSPERIFKVGFAVLTCPQVDDDVKVHAIDRTRLACHTYSTLHVQHACGLAANSQNYFRIFKNCYLQ